MSIIYVNRQKMSNAGNVSSGVHYGDTAPTSTTSIWVDSRTERTYAYHRGVWVSNMHSVHGSEGALILLPANTQVIITGYWFAYSNTQPSLLIRNQDYSPLLSIDYSLAVGNDRLLLDAFIEVPVGSNNLCYYCDSPDYKPFELQYRYKRLIS